MNRSCCAFDVNTTRELIQGVASSFERRRLQEAISGYFSCVLYFGRVSTMTAKQPFRDGKFGDRKSVTAGPISIPSVIQLTRRISGSPYRDSVGPDAPE